MYQSKTISALEEVYGTRYVEDLLGEAMRGNPSLLGRIKHGIGVAGLAAGALLGSGSAARGQDADRSLAAGNDAAIRHTADVHRGEVAQARTPGEAAQRQATAAKEVERATSQAQRMEATAKRLAAQRAEDARVRASQNPVR